MDRPPPTPRTRGTCSPPPLTGFRQSSTTAMKTLPRHKSIISLAIKTWHPRPHLHTTRPAQLLLHLDLPAFIRATAGRLGVWVDHFITVRSCRAQAIKRTQALKTCRLVVLASFFLGLCLTPKFMIFSRGRFLLLRPQLSWTAFDAQCTLTFDCFNHPL